MTQTATYLRSFEEIETKMKRVILSKVAPFKRDQMVSRLYDIDDLYNIALLKLHEAVKNYIWDDSLSEDMNEGRFVAMVVRYVTNAMIDEQYSLNLKKRKPARGFIYIDQTGDECDGAEQSESIDVAAKQHHCSEVLIESEFATAIRSQLDDKERSIFDLVSIGLSAEEIAGRIGSTTGKVRYIIHKRIQKVASDYLKSSHSHEVKLQRKGNHVLRR